MLTPDYLLHCADGAEQLSSELHTAILRKIIERINIRKKRGDDYVLTATDKWQIQNLTDAGFLLKDIQAELAKYTGYQAAEIGAAMEDAGVTATGYDDEIYKAAGIEPTPIRKSPHYQRLLQRGYEKTMGSWENLTGTTANSTHQLFIKTLDQVWAAVTSGGEGYIQAYTDAIDRIAEDGLIITYPSGHRDTIETATLRAIRTGISQTTAEIQTARMDEVGWDLVTVSSHQGARPSHQVWQGKIYSRSGASGYEDFVTATHYGEGDGLCGWNCRHHFSPYFPGLVPPYKDYSNEENVRLYELSQEQRAMERSIRKTKRQIACYETAMDGATGQEDRDRISFTLSAKRKRLKDQMEAYNEFCGENGLRPLKERLAIAKAGRKKENTDLPDITIKPRPPEIKPAVPPVTPPVNPPVNQRETPPPVQPGVVYKPTKPFDPRNRQRNTQTTEEFGKLVNGCKNKTLVKLFSMYGDWFNYVHDPAGRYVAADKEVHWHHNFAGTKSKYSTLAHEMGHGFDFRIGQNVNTFDGRRLAISKAMAKSGGFELLGFAPGARPSQSDEFVDALMADIKALKGRGGLDVRDIELITGREDTAGFEDFLDAVFDAQASAPVGYMVPKVAYGHGWEYWQRAVTAATRYGGTSALIDELRNEGVDIDISKGLDAAREQLIELMRAYVNASEIWANITESIVNEENGKNYYLFEKYCPNAMRAYQHLIEQHVESTGTQPSRTAGAPLREEVELREATVQTGEPAGKKPRRATGEERPPGARNASEIFSDAIINGVKPISDEERAALDKREGGPDLSAPMTKYRKKRRTSYKPEDIFFPGSDNVGKLAAKEFGKLVSSCKDRDIIELYNLYGDYPKYRYSDDDSAGWFKEKTMTVSWKYVNKKFGSEYHVLAHETGHAIDALMDSVGISDYTINEIISAAMLRDGTLSGYLHAPTKCPSQSDSFIRAVFADINAMTERRKIDDEDKALIKKYRGVGFQDFLDGAYPTDLRLEVLDWIPHLNAGHGDKYYDRKYTALKYPSLAVEYCRQHGMAVKSKADLKEILRAYMTATELWANINDAFVTYSDTEGIEKGMLEKYCPNSVAEYKRLIKAHLTEVERDENETIRQFGLGDD